MKDRAYDPCQQRTSETDTPTIVQYLVEEFSAHGIDLGPDDVCDIAWAVVFDGGAWEAWEELLRRTRREIEKGRLLRGARPLPPVGEGNQS